MIENVIIKDSNKLLNERVVEPIPEVYDGVEIVDVRLSKGKLVIEYRARWFSYTNYAMKMANCLNLELGGWGTAYCKYRKPYENYTTMETFMCWMVIE